MPNPTHRRSFLGRLAAGGAALTAGLAVTGRPLDAMPTAPASARDDFTPARHPQDDWYDKIPGKHRLFLDATDDAEAAAAVGFAWNFLRTSQTGYNLKDADQAVVICLRHYATKFAFSNATWEKYDVLRKVKYQHPETEKKVRGGNAFRLGSTSPASVADGFTLEGMAKRGVHFAICGVATRGLAGQIAGKGATHDAVETVMTELVAALPDNAHLMASGILAAQRAGEYGYTVIRG